ncbi:MAG: molybdopterin-dependent oxidoreductase [Candidatus Bathyarchaeia archaeon]
MDGDKVVKTTLWSPGPGCHGGCGALLHVKDGKLVKVEGDEGHPWNQGRLCPRALALIQYVYHPNRLLYPMKRVGERGQGRWKRITWEEAFQEIEEKLREVIAKYGPQSICIGRGTGRNIWPAHLLAWSLGTPNAGDFGLSGFSCYYPRIGASWVTIGDLHVVDAAQWWDKRYDDPNYVVPKCIIVWGNNPPAVCPDGFFGHWIVDLAKKGAELVVIDPRCTWLATRARYWLQVRPGTDSALALGLLHVIIREKLYDEHFVKKWTNAPHLIRMDTKEPLREWHVIKGAREDFEKAGYYAWDKKSREIVKYDPTTVSYEKFDVDLSLEGSYNVRLIDGSEVECKPVWQLYLDRLAEYSPEKVEQITWVPKDKLVEAAGFYAKSRPAAIQWGVAIDHGGESFRAAQSITQLAVITGNIDVPGGNVIARPTHGPSFFMPIYLPPFFHETMPLDKLVERCIGADKWPLIRDTAGILVPVPQMDDVYEAIKTGKPWPIKFLWLQTSNILACMGADPRGWYEALRKNVDFIVVVDAFLTPTAAALADMVLPAASIAERIGGWNWWCPLSSIEKAIEPLGECKSDMEICLTLAKNFNPLLQRIKDEEDFYDKLLRLSGLTYEELRKKHVIFPPEDNPWGSKPYKRYERGLLRGNGEPGFATPSGLAEIYSTRLKKWGYDPFPYYREPRPHSPIETPELYREYPLILGSGRRIIAYFHSEHRQIPWLREIHPDPIVEIHPKTAEKLGIKDGDWVWIENNYGRCKRKAKLTPAVHPQMVMADHGWWLPELPSHEPSLFGLWEFSLNQLVPMGYVCETGWGGAPYKTMLCKVYRAE